MLLKFNVIIINYDVNLFLISKKLSSIISPFIMLRLLPLSHWFNFIIILNRWFVFKVIPLETYYISKVISALILIISDLQVTSSNYQFLIIKYLVSIDSL